MRPSRVFATLSDQGVSFTSFTYPFHLWQRPFTAQISYRVMARFPDLDRQAEAFFERTGHLGRVSIDSLGRE